MMDWITKNLIGLALVLLGAVASYFVYAFTLQVAPPEVAMAAAGSLVGTYVGLAFAPIAAHQRARAQRVAQAAMIIEAAYGALYVLSVQTPGLFAHPIVDLRVSLPLAALHGSAFSVLAYFVSMLVVHRDAAPAHAAQPVREPAAQPAQAPAQALEPAALVREEPAQVVARLRDAGEGEREIVGVLRKEFAHLPNRQIAQLVGRPESTVRGWP